MAKTGGFSLIEPLLAAAILASSLLAFSLAYSQARRTEIAAQQRELAWRAMTSFENAMRAAPYASLYARRIALPVPELPDGLADLQIQALPNLNAFEATFALGWRGPRGPERLSHAVVLSPYVAPSLHAAP
jgi:type II secretory pathway pseudopilin PulG